MAKKYRDSADFSQSSFVKANRPASDVISTFNGDFGDADSEALLGFGDTEENYNPFQRQSKYAVSDDSDFEDEFEVEEEDDEEEPINVPQDTTSIVKQAAKEKAIAALMKGNASPEAIAEVTAAIDAIKPEAITQAVADTIALKKSDFAHPILKIQKAKLSGGFEGMGDWFSDLRDTVVQSTTQQATKSAQQLATTAVQAVVAPVASTLAKAASTPEAQAALQQAANTGISQMQSAFKAKINEFWTNYRLPILIGAGGIVALTAFLIIRKRK